MPDQPAESETLPTEPPLASTAQGINHSQAATRLDPRSADAIKQAQRAPESGDELKGRYHYRLEKRLGRGGFGTVFLAECLDTSAEGTEVPPPFVAVKIFTLPEMHNPRTFLSREIGTLKSLSHPRIPKVYDWAVDGNTAFFVMPYFSRDSLYDLRAYLGRLEETIAWRLLADLLSALVAAHGRGILHLDIKPANVLLDEHAGFILTDFGVATFLMGTSQGISPGLGTAGYQAPEQVAGRQMEPDARTDLWGVGATLWSMCTGVELSGSLHLRQDRIRGAAFGLPDLGEERPELSKALTSTIMRLLAVSPSDRPGGAAEVLAQVRSAVARDPQQVRALTASRRLSLTTDEVIALRDEVLDPVWSRLLQSDGMIRELVRYDDGEYLGREGEQSHFAFALLKGTIAVEREGRVIERIDREGVFLGEISTLTGSPRTASMRAEGPVVAAVFNGAEFDNFVTCNPAVGLRLLREMAGRIVHDRTLGKPG